MMKKRIIAMLLCGILAVSAFSACDKAPVDPTDTENGEVTDVDGSAVAVKIGDYEVTVDRYSSYAESVMLSSLRYSDSTDEFKIDDKEYMDDFIADVTDNFKQYAAYEEYAKSIGVEDPTQEEIDAMTDDFVSYYQMYGFDIRAEIGDEFDELMRIQTIMTKTIDKLAEDVTAEEALAGLADGTYRAKHILISADDTLSEEELAEKEKLANEVYEKAAAGEDFDALIKEYGEDPGTESNPDGYTFGEGEMVPEFYEGTAALEENEISKPVKSSFGFHIIQRLPVVATESMKQDVAYNKMNADINEILDSLVPEYTDAFKSIDFKAMYNRVKDMVDAEKAAAEADAKAEAEAEAEADADAKAEDEADTADEEKTEDDGNVDENVDEIIDEAVDENSESVIAEG